MLTITPAGKYGTESKLHRQLRLVGGAQANRRLLSSQGSQTRPMMEKVGRVLAAIFGLSATRSCFSVVYPVLSCVMLGLFGLSKT